MLTCLVPVLFIFYIQGVLKLKKNNSGAKGLKQNSSDNRRGGVGVLFMAFVYLLYTMSCRQEFVDRFRLGVVMLSFNLLR